MIREYFANVHTATVVLLGITICVLLLSDVVAIAHV